MSHLSDLDITQAIHRGHITVTPWNPALLQPASIDVTVGDEWLRPAHQLEADTSLRDMAYYQTIADRFVVQPGMFVLGTTQQTIAIDCTLAARFDGKSSLGRMGLMTHVTAGFIDPGFSGQITLEIVNVGPTPLTIRAGQRIGQVTFSHLTTPTSAPYGDPRWGSRYQHQAGTTGVRA